MSFLAALMMLYEPVKGVTKINTTIQQGLAAATRIFTLLQIQPDIKEHANAQELEGFRETLVFQDASFSYEEGVSVLKHINLRVHRGEVVALVGPSGGGKSTLANLIPRFYDISQGALLIDGVDVRNLTFASLRHQMALVTQQTILFNDTVRNNIAYGREVCSEEEIVDAARLAHALDFILDLPQGFETKIGESGARLSYNFV